MPEPSEGKPTRKGVSPLSGTAPPVEHQFKKGQPQHQNANRDTTGAIIKNYLNGFARRRVRTSTLTRYKDGEDQPHFKRVAASRALAAMDEGADFDRIIEHTDGRPKQTTENNINVVFRTPADRDVAATQAAERLRALLNPSGN